MRVIIRAFNSDGYHKDIVEMSEKQIYMTDRRIDDKCMSSVMSGLLGVSAGIDPTLFPEMSHFEVVIKT